MVIDDSVRRLPHFDPDLEAAAPEEVLRFRAACEVAEGLLIAVPEYAFGIPGAFKNALDWTVGSGSLYRKPVAVLDVAPPGRGEQARQALDRVLEALDADFAHYAVPVSQRPERERRRIATGDDRPRRPTAERRRRARRARRARPSRTRGLTREPQCTSTSHVRSHHGNQSSPFDRSLRARPRPTRRSSSP